MKTEIDIETIDSAALRMRFSLVPWDTQLLGYRVAQVQSIEVLDSRGAHDVFEDFERWRDQNQIHLVSCRLPNLALHESMFLEEHDFRYIETVYSPQLDLSAPAPSPTQDRIAVALAGSEDVDQIVHIAGVAFTTGRFALDWRLDPSDNQRRYQGWVRNSFADAAHNIWKATKSTEVVGFFITEDLPLSVTYWHLTAIAPAWQGHGMGRRLWLAMIDQSRNAGQAFIKTTVSGHNVSVINLYASLGFRLHEPRSTYHWTRRTS